MGFKKVLFCIPVVGILALFQTGCAKSEKFVEVSEKCTRFSVMLYVPTVMKETSFQIVGDKLKVVRSTQVVKISGSGVMVSPNGHILTCAHLFTNGPAATVPTAVMYGDLVVPFEILYMDVNRDLALVKVEGTRHPYVRIADPRKLRVGQEVLAIGNPLGLEFTVTHGIISYLNRDFPFRYDAMQSDTFINPGNSGGGLFNMRGELVGINSFIIPPVRANIFTGCGFSVSTNEIIRFLTKFRQTDKALPKLGTAYFRGLLNALGFNTGD